MTNTKSIALKVLLVTLVLGSFLTVAAGIAGMAQARSEARATQLIAHVESIDANPDVLVLDYEAGVPETLWDAAQDAGYVGDPNDGCECLYIPVGTELDVPGGLALATVDGWMGCQDWVTSDAECSATGPVEVIDRGWATRMTPSVQAASWTTQDSQVAAARAAMDDETVSEDSPAWRCAVNGNHVCGPGNSEGADAGCYRDGVLAVEWTRYDDPRQDPLWAQLTPPC